MKKVLIDANILDKQKIQLMNKKGLLKKKGHLFKFYISEIVLKQRLVQLYYSNYSEQYDFYIEFIKTWCEPGIVDSAADIAKREIDNNFIPAKVISNFRIYHLYSREKAKKQLELYKQELNNSRKLEIGSNYKNFIKDEKQNIAKLQSSQDWENYCRQFIAKYNFAVKELNYFLSTHKKYNRQVYLDMVKLWWKYTTIAGVLRYFNTQNADQQAIEIINNITKLSKRSFLYRQFKADKFILDYTLVKDKKFDYDSPNDVIYLSVMKDFDILLTDDESFMKDCFKTLYPNKNKQILTLKDFIRRYR